MSKKSSKKSARAKDAKAAATRKPIVAKKIPTPKATPSKTRVKPPPPLSDEEKARALDQRRLVLLAKAAKGPHGRYVKFLLDLRDRLLDDIEFHASDNLRRTQKDASSDLSAYSVHMADAGTDNFDREFALSMVSNEQEALYEIDEALKRLENGTYGICEMSGKPIPKARLDAIPWARYTVECQSEMEKSHQKRLPQTFQLSDFGNSEEEVVEKEEED
ncbi:MAG: TraR/DksA C4-type zinc finger protein [Verrucomicrobia bacterium]|nr:TraR/DksA C4-type zinc finger protein [Verrucomicrobiota bacterium]